MRRSGIILERPLQTGEQDGHADAFLFAPDAVGGEPATRF